MNLDDENNIHNIINYDISANRNVLEEDLDETFHYNWEDEFFKKFEWLDKASLTNGDTTNKFNLFMDCCNILQNGIDIHKEPNISDDYHYNKLYMYFISLDGDNLFLHTDFKKDYDEIIKECENKYDYVKLHKPNRVIFVTEINDLYDVDKYVKMFMHMFGIDKTRGGSYIDIVLDDFLLKSIEHEKEITTMDYYLK